LGPFEGAHLSRNLRASRKRDWHLRWEMRTNGEESQQEYYEVARRG